MYKLIQSCFSELFLYMTCRTLGKHCIIISKEIVLKKFFVCMRGFKGENRNVEIFLSTIAILQSNRAKLRRQSTLADLNVMQWGAAAVGQGGSFYSRVLTESSGPYRLLDTYHVPGTVHFFILTASCEVGIISSFLRWRKQVSETKILPKVNGRAAVQTKSTESWGGAVSRSFRCGCCRTRGNLICPFIFLKTVRPFKDNSTF